MQTVNHKIYGVGEVINKETTENGSYIAENGVIVLSDIDYLKFLSGELDVYALVEDLQTL